MNKMNISKSETQLQYQNTDKNSKSISKIKISRNGMPKISSVSPIIPFAQTINTHNLKRTMEILASKGKGLRVYDNFDNEKQNKKDENKFESPETILKRATKTRDQLCSSINKKKSKGSMFVTELWDDRLYYDIIATTKVKEVLEDMEKWKRKNPIQRINSLDKYFQNKYEQTPLNLNSIGIENSLQKNEENKRIPSDIIEVQEISMDEEVINVSNTNPLERIPSDYSIKKTYSPNKLTKEQESPGLSSNMKIKDIMPMIEYQIPAPISSANRIPSLKSSPIRSNGAIIYTSQYKKITSYDKNAPVNVNHTYLDEKQTFSGQINSKIAENTIKVRHKSRMNSLFTESSNDNIRSSSPLLSNRTKMLNQRFYHPDPLGILPIRVNNANIAHNEENKVQTYHKKNRKMFFLSSGTLPKLVTKTEISKRTKHSYALSACKSIDNIIDICEDATENNNKIFQIIDKELNISYGESHVQKIKNEKKREKYRIEKLSEQIKSRLFSRPGLETIKKEIY